MNNIIDNYSLLKKQIDNICKNNNIDYPVKIIAVSKTFPVADIIELHTSTKHIAFGENYAQELHDKAEELKHYSLNWHFIGNIQSNKIKYIAKYAAWVHSLEKAKHALYLNKYRPINLPKLNILIEVKISEDENKHGINNFDEILALAKIISTQDNLRLRGLMGMSGANADIDTKHRQFKQLKQFFDKLKISGFADIDTLSMGMSDDFELALQNGANMLRIGSLIFGNRNDIK